MDPGRLAELLEEIKRLRRNGDSRSLEQLADSIARRDPPEGSGLSADAQSRLADVMRIAGARLMARRVFGDSDRAEKWMSRPNAALSGQRPADLLQDELGAAVVQEMLEQIDHGIFT